MVTNEDVQLRGTVPGRSGPSCARLGAPALGGQGQRFPPGSACGPGSWVRAALLPASLLHGLCPALSGGVSRCCTFPPPCLPRPPHPCLLASASPQEAGASQRPPRVWTWVQLRADPEPRAEHTVGAGAPVQARPVCVDCVLGVGSRLCSSTCERGSCRSFESGVPQDARAQAESQVPGPLLGAPGPDGCPFQRRFLSRFLKTPRAPFPPHALLTPWSDAAPWASRPSPLPNPDHFLLSSCFQGV